MLDRKFEAKLKVIYAELEEKGLDPKVLDLQNSMRSVRCAATDEITVTSWDDFRNFWDKHVGPELIYLIIDTYGANHPLVAKVKELVTRYTKLEADLHSFYMSLKGSDTEAAESEESSEQVVDALKNLEQTK
jgi:hypothetical protein